MNIDAMSVRRDMRSYVEAAMAMQRDPAEKDSPSTIINSISFSNMLENALRMELLKGQSLIS